ncbi:FxLYD domain-containing protein [Halobium salinum]|uniref:FxLYD domain-containing protein n=1 Tax=Halobium salinum TaxID=1364940 RepID=A0ABD5PEF6_9EURY|nr:FxLYD domain-containing protein [Halobium salinum]
MRTESLDFELVDVSKAGPLARDVTARVTNVSGGPLDDVRVALLVAAGDRKVAEFAANLGDLDPGETRSMNRTISASPGEAFSLKANGADLHLVARIADRVERAQGTLSF